MPTQTLHYVKEKVKDLLKKGHYKEASQLAKILCEKYPDDVECYFLLGIALLDYEKYDKARRVVLRAIGLFPKEWRLYELLGNVYEYLNKIPDAEKEYRAALEKSGNALTEEIALLHCSVAETLWAQKMREEASDEWKLALKIDPVCKEAIEALKECTNEYGEPRAPSNNFNDLYHFQGIHTQRYFALVGREDFVSDKEAQAVIDIIQYGWNSNIPPRVQEFDRMTPNEKSEFFKSITLNFKDAVMKWRNN